MDKDMLTAGVWLIWRENLNNVQLGAREKIGNLTMLQVAQTAAIEGWACAEVAPPGTKYHTVVVAYRDDRLGKVRLHAYRQVPRGATAAPVSAAEAERNTTGCSGLPVSIAAQLSPDANEACVRYSGPRRHRAGLMVAEHG
jgi:hypothetical protein